MADKEDVSSVMVVINKAYDLAVDGVPGLGSAEELAEEYLDDNPSAVDAANSLIRWQCAKAGTAGFVTGLGGAITLPVTIPASFASNIYLQLRMIAAIAHMGGYDIRSDKVRTFVYMCLVGKQMNDLLKDFGVQLGTKMASSLLKEIPGKLLIEINKAVGFRLITKAGSTGLVNLGKAIPFLGGAIGGTVEAVSTNVVGNKARDFFIAQ